MRYPATRLPFGWTEERRCLLCRRPFIVTAKTKTRRYDSEACADLAKGLTSRREKFAMLGKLSASRQREQAVKRAERLLVGRTPLEAARLIYKRGYAAGHNARMKTMRRLVQNMRTVMASLRRQLDTQSSSGDLSARRAS